jgi:hypothetical protein
MVCSFKGIYVTPFPTRENRDPDSAEQTKSD